MIETNKYAFKIRQQRFLKGIVISVTGKDKTGVEYAFMIIKPDEFVKIASSAYTAGRPVCSITGEVVSFSSNLGIKRVKVHIAPKNYVERSQSIRSPK